MPMDPELKEFLTRLETKVDQLSDNIDETKKISEALRHGQEVLEAKVTSY